MKRFLLLISAMLVMSSIIAQDVYTAGWYYGSSDNQIAAVYKNGAKIYEFANSSYHYQATDVVRFNGNTYWSFNCSNPSTGNDIWAAVYKNGERYLELPIVYDGGLKINDMCMTSNLIFSAGSTNVSGVQRAALWRGNETTPIRTFGNSSFASEALCCAIITGNVTVGGYEWVTGTDYEGKIWRGSDVLYSIPNAEVRSLDIYQNNIYYLVHYSTGAYKVCVEDEELFTITEGGTTEVAYKLRVIGGVVYVAGYGPSTARIWRYSDDSGMQIIFDQDAYEADDVFVTSNGIYYAGHSNDDEGMIWLGEDELYTPSNCNHINGMFVEEPACANSGLHTLPYSEYFEFGDNEWTCWTKTTNTNNDYASYWHLSTYLDMDDNSAVCRYNVDAVVESWLISPQISLAGTTAATLYFYTYEGDPEFFANGYEGVWISTTGTNPSDFTEIWTQTDPDNSWHYKNIDISAYAGQNIYIGFKYSGQDAHIWYVDDIRVTGNEGVNDITSENLAVYPNPARDVIRINGLEQEVEVNIYNATGALVKTVVVNGAEEINVNELPAGLYLARFGENTLRFTKE